MTTPLEAATPNTTDPGTPATTGRRGITPSQTVGPYLAIGLTWDDGEDVVAPGPVGAITISGQLLDGAGDPIPDGLVETWQADPSGGFVHPDDPRSALNAPPTGFRGFGRSKTRPDGTWRVSTLRPGPVPATDGTLQAPHLDVSVFARGMLDRVVTRIYLPEDVEAQAGDPVLTAVPADRRATLIARPVGDTDYRFDIRLQGDGETVFFDV